jgi:ribosomal protein S20
MYCHISCTSFSQRKEAMDKKQSTLVIDGLRSYHDTVNKEFYTSITSRDMEQLYEFLKSMFHLIYLFVLTILIKR